MRSILKVLDLERNEFIALEDVTKKQVPKIGTECTTVSLPLDVHGKRNMGRVHFLRTSQAAGKKNLLKQSNCFHFAYGV